MSSLFCCSSPRSYKNQSISHESKFRTFMAWAEFPKESTATNLETPNSDMASLFVVQLVRQVNYGPLESKRYFVMDPNHGAGETFVEVHEQWLVDANMQKLNSYKNYKCDVHNKFFELNVYQKDPVNAHHWRANIARPATEIDI